MPVASPAPTSLGKVHRHGGTIRSRQPLTIETSAVPWDYAVSVKVALPASVPRIPFVPEWVAVTVTIETGELSLILVGEDQSTSLGPMPMPIGIGTHTAYLKWEQGGTEGRLVFRNGSNTVSCVFTIDNVVTGFAPRLLPPAPSNLQYVVDWSKGHGQAKRLLLTDELLNVHNQAQSLGDARDRYLRRPRFEFVTDPPQWGYSVSYPIDVPAEHHSGSQPCLVADIHVLEGAVGVGVLDEKWDNFLTPEVDTRAGSDPVRVELRLPAGGSRVHLMARNTFDTGPSRFMLQGITLRSTPRRAALLTSLDVPAIHSRIDNPTPVSGSFDILVSHSSRHWIREQCDRQYLRQRWARPGRLEGLQPFDSLPPHAAPYYGLLSVLRIELSPRGVTGRLLHHYSSPEKIVHAAAMGRSVVVAFDDGVAIFDRRDQGDCLDIDPDSGRRILDPWFGGLHTVIPIDDTTCLLSSSGADAVLWLDIARGTVVKRWRLPRDRYGSNYELDSTTWLTEHYVSNDFQLGHLNCAFPDGRGGAFVSALGQGDVGHVDEAGRFELLTTDFVGCHGVRLSQNGWPYFCDSCSGRLMRIDGPQEVTTLFETGSRWLHDAVHLTEGIFLMTVADRNGLLLADVDRGQTLAEWDFGEADGTVQFLNPIRHHTP